MLEQFYSGHRSLTELPSISACLQWHMPSLTLHLKSLQHVVKSLPEGNLHFFSPPLLRVRPVRNTKEENCHCIAPGGTVSDTLYSLQNSIDKLLLVITPRLACAAAAV